MAYAIAWTYFLSLVRGIGWLPIPLVQSFGFFLFDMNKLLHKQPGAGEMQQLKAYVTSTKYYCIFPPANAVFGQALM